MLSFCGRDVGIVVAFGAALIAFPLQAREYQVRAGDTLMDIARSQLGSAAGWRELCEINSDRLDDCDLILAGMTLRLAPEPAQTGAPEAEARAPEPAITEALTETTSSAPPPAANQLPNDSLRGAAIGALADGGSLPDAWGFFATGGADATLTVLDVTDDWVDVQIDQAGDSGIVFVQFARSGSFVETRPGQAWLLSVDLAVIEQDNTGNWQANLQGSQWAANDANRSLGAFVFAGDLPLGPELATFSGVAVTNSPEAELVNPDLRLVSSGPWMATFRIGVPSFTHAPH